MSCVDRQASRNCPSVTFRCTTGAVGDTGPDNRLFPAAFRHQAVRSPYSAWYRTSRCCGVGCSTVPAPRDFVFALPDGGRRRHLWLSLLELPWLVEQVPADLKWLPVSSSIMAPVSASGTHGPPSSGGSAGSCFVVCPERSSRSTLLQGQAEDTSRENGRCE